MEIKGKVHCFFEQSGTFKNEFKKLGYDAYDYDIQNNFDETDYKNDLFKEIENAYDGKPSLFDRISKDDLIMAFFPCIYFCGSNNPLEFSFATHTSLSLYERTQRIIQRSRDRQYFYELLLKMVAVCIKKELRLIIENPHSSMGYLTNNFVKKPDIVDENRMMRGDYFKKPTDYWFFNCEPTHLFTIQNNKEQKIIRKCRNAKEAGICSEERSMISPDYARNFICDFILGKKQDIGQLNLF